MSITVTPTNFTLGQVEISQSTNSFFTVSTPSTVTGVSISSNDSHITLREGQTGAFSSSISMDLDNEEKDVNVACLPTSATLTTGSITVTYNSSTVATISYTFTVFESLANYSSVYAKSIYARDGIFSANTVKIGTSSISMTEKGDKLNFAGASGITYNIGKATQIDDGRVNPLTSITVEKSDESILIKNNNQNSVKIDSDGSVRVDNNVIICSDVLNETDNDWKLEKLGSTTMALYKKVSGSWEQRIVFD
tara:strand:- start:1557 stop:2309 length:753 start_codon:yes stop_codon:yes gene_type:complete